MELLCWLTAIVIGIGVVPSLTSFFVEGAWRDRWRIEGARPETLTLDGQGAFRDAPVRAVVAAVERDRAPLGVRVMAFSCWLLAQMVIPGFLCFCVGVMMLGERHRDPVAIALTVSFFPGAWCAWLLWSAGCALVRGERARADHATRRAATVVIAYNALAIAASVVWLMDHPHENVLGLSLAYCALSIVHVIAVRAAFTAHRESYPIENAQP